MGMEGATPGQALKHPYRVHVALFRPSKGPSISLKTKPIGFACIQVARNLAVRPCQFHTSSHDPSGSTEGCPRMLEGNMLL